MCTRQARGNRGYLAKGDKETILQKRNTISLQLRVSVSVLYIFYFAYSKLSVLTELCVRRYHYILLIIQVQSGIVEVMDPKSNDPELWADMSAMLQR